jgi:DNA-binding NarL/FixJ family response regulator
MLEGDPAHPHATLALLRTLTFDVSLLDAAEAQGEAHDAVVTSSAPWRAEPVRGVLEHLTLRENDVLQLLAHGMSNREIAKALTVTVNTVKTHLTGIYSKLDVHSRMEAVMRAQALGLVSTGAGTRSQTPDPRDHDREFSTRRNPVPRNHPDG